MILIKRAVLLAFGILAAAAALFVGIYAYHLVVASIPAASGSDAASAAKTIAESVLFSAIVVATLIILAVAAIVGRSLFLTRELDKIVGMSRYHDFSPEASLKKLGAIGDRLSALYRNANAISESKSLKISALSELDTFLVLNLPSPVVIADLTGRIVHASRSFEEKVELDRNQLLDANLGTVIEGLPWNEVEMELLRRRIPVSRKTDLGELTFFPIENRADEIAYVVCSLEKAEKMWLPESMRHDREAPAAGAGAEHRPRRSVIGGLRSAISGFRRGTRQ